MMNRSENMRRIKSKGMIPEMFVRKTAHQMGYRYRLHRRTLPGRPDIVFSSKRRVIFVNGCFWHQHKGCIDGRLPKTNKEYWIPKLKRNCIRDNVAITALEKDKWKVLVIWECETKDPERIKRKLNVFLGKR
jgi:DNA mismatch endonuclease (patch repair protein)